VSNAQASPTVHLVGAIAAQDLCAETLRIGDLDGDGAPDLLFVQSVHGTREITCLTAVALGGDVLWQVGTPDAKNALVYSDLPVQVYDWDGDGRTEVLYVRQAQYLEVHDPSLWYRERARRYGGETTMVVLDGTTGEEKTSLPLPAPADDCILFVDLTGRGRRQDFVVKDRYWNLWGVSAEGRVLWHWEGSTGHYPAYGDVDGDGRDEIFVGFALIDHDGTVLFEHDCGGSHQDAAYMVRLPDGSWRLAFGNHGVHCLAPDGTELWSHPLQEAQHVVAGRFRPELGPVQFMVIDRGQPRPEGDRWPGVLYLYDLEGREVWRREQPAGSWCASCVEIDWSGAGEPREVLVSSRGPGQPAAIHDGWGEIVDLLPVAHAPHPTEGAAAEYYDAEVEYCYAARADVWGDSRQEAILFGAWGASIWSNARPLAVPTLYNNTLYPGM